MLLPSNGPLNYRNLPVYYSVESRYEGSGDKRISPFIGNEKYMRLVQKPRSTFRDYAASPPSPARRSGKTLLFTGGCSAASLALAPVKNGNGGECRREKAQKPPAAAAASTLSSSNTHVFQVVVMRVSLHCQGCASKVKKHLSKMEGVTSFSIDLENKKVTVMGNVSPAGVLESVSKVKRAEFWPY
ncbi:PREDICTED: protein SODIUM POTASSIUM ROOT DEFECTIVE 1-like isoform X2 [Ipomoea nil]|uniref:protein SODIUM POTASSIUM ROOT DEFECTIVE 1-like isoform X2 n=1 Tax=Ipomoea nil TaxID=35883 RepID=UPI000900B07B|nr:PREDICTED: protein SODIUM POTASSIUM ROOT DEFECTIVE 1-like isoform X2 [Ipomoea nil]